MRAKGLMAAAAIAVMLMAALAVSCDWQESDSADYGGGLLLDMGNGSTEWCDTVSGETVGEMIEATLTDYGHSCVLSGNTLTIDDRTSSTIGSSKTSNDVLSVPGTSGVKVTSVWTVYSWDGDGWTVVSDLSSHPDGTYAVGFYPSGTVPAETPDHKAVTCFGTDALMSHYTEAEISGDEPSLSWSMTGIGGNSSVYSQLLSAGGYVFIKFGTGSGEDKDTACMVCADLASGEVKWYFRYAVTYYETTTAAIVGDNLYVQSSFGKMFKIPWRTAEGDISSSDIVTTFYGQPSDSRVSIPLTVPEGVSGETYSDGFTSISYDSGALFVGSSTGMIYCFDLDLNPIWSCQTYGVGYTYAPSVDDDYVYAGQFDGHLYVIDKTDGRTVLDQEVYVKNGKGSVGPISVIEKDGSEYLCFVYNEGRGMSNSVYGIAMYEVLKGSASSEASLKEVYKGTGYGSMCGYVTPLVTDDAAGAYFFCTKDSVPSVGFISITGDVRVLDSEIYTTHAPAINVNNQCLVASSYTKGQPLMQIDLAGRDAGEYWVDGQYTEYCMTDVLVMDGYYIGGNDAAVYCVKGGFSAVKGGGTGDSGPSVLAIAIGAIVIVILAIYLIMRFALGWEHPWQHLMEHYNEYMHGERYSHNTQRRHKLRLVMLLGIVLTAAVCLISLCAGPTSVMGLGDMFSNLFSAIGKGGQNLTYDELMIYSVRLPRTLVALAVGIGLSVAGAMYQAIIRNPLVDPYIMGVSSGAGTAAIAVIAFDFTFFGLFPSHSIYLTAIAAALGGLLAYGCTMVLANKAGGSSINYVLAGVIVGLVFGAIQTLMLTFAGDEVSGALSWLYGSFAEITWSKVWIVVIPALAMAFASLFWAKEFNLVLLGEDQARQMGLNVKRFNLLMLTIASVLTAICVAFCGIIGFVGLVIPHLCRMMLGGDHRLVLPASMAFGGFLMIAADVLARMVIPGLELPVGAITTIIGVPVFAWLLIKRGKMYDG